MSRGGSRGAKQKYLTHRKRMQQVPQKRHLCRNEDAGQTLTQRSKPHLLERLLSVSFLQQDLLGKVAAKQNIQNTALGVIDGFRRELGTGDAGMEFRSVVA